MTAKNPKEPCDHNKCVEHSDMIVATRTNKTIMLVFGSLGTVFITILVGIATMGHLDSKRFQEQQHTQWLQAGKELSLYKEQSTERWTDTAVQLMEISGDKAITDMKLNQIAKDVDRLSIGIEDIKTLVTKNNTFAEATRDTSTLRLFDNYGY